MKINKHIIVITAGLLFLFIGVFFPPKYIMTEDAGMKPDKKYEFFRDAVDTLIARGIDTSFIRKLVMSEETQFNEKYVKINITGYLKQPDYSEHYNSESVDECRKFQRENKKVLYRVQEKFNVPAKYIIAILWIESKLGSYTGRHHVPSVLLSTAVSNRKEYIKLNYDEVDKLKELTPLGVDTIKRKINIRVKTKSEWALNELMYLDSIRRKLPTSVFSLYGSWAGAFGIAQFLPSSYYKWAVDGNGDKKVDLFNIDDAVFSIGNYLKSNGWSDAEADRRAAVFHYNNSNDYVDAVLLLASRL